MGNNPTEVICPFSALLFLKFQENAIFSAKMKATYRRHCLLKSRGWQKIHSTNESKAGSKNERNSLKAVSGETAWDLPYGQADPPHPHRENEEQTLGI